MPEEFPLKDRLSYYEDGKHRRYSLLFSVNGGAFAIAKLLVDHSGPPANVLGHLTLRQLSWGMIFFTFVMVADIYAFGFKVKRNYLPAAFDLRGKLVLISIGLISCYGWFLAGRP